MGAIGDPEPDEPEPDEPNPEEPLEPEDPADPDDGAEPQPDGSVTFGGSDDGVVYAVVGLEEEDDEEP
jgi:hypothetical protein